MTRICLVGYGNIARKHIEVLKAFGGEIVASCNRSEKGNNAAKAEGGIPTTYTNYMEMIEQEKPDAVLVCVTHNGIYKVTKELIPLGIPLLIEKPAGTSVAQVKELIELQEKYNTPVQVALNRRHYSIFNKAVESLGGAENIDMMSVEWSERPIRARDDKGYTDELVEALLIGNSIHGIDLLNYYSGEIKEFYPVTRSREDEYYQWNMAFSGVSEKGVLTTFSNSWGSPVPWRVVMYSKGKRLEFAPLETCRVYTDGQKEVGSIVPDEYDETYKAGFYKQAEYFFELLKTGKANPKYDLKSSLRSTEIAETLLNKLKVD